MTDRFRSVLVANRGEIACRVVRACNTLGLDTVAVCSEADRRSLHVEAAQRFEVLGPASARESYLRADRIIEAALRSGAQAVHPGYGFLSENADFAQAVLDANLVWIGPSPETIAEMGNKPRARELAADAGVPVLPAGRLNGDTVDQALELAQRIGFPLLIKAAAGGGGIGIQRVDSPEALQQAIERTRSLGSRLFGSGQVYLEKFIPIARHIEVQVLGDGRGHVIHLFERDCSVQRRFQKVIEETPAPALSEESRQALCRDAVRFAESRRYAGPGTVEFIVDAATQSHYFLEMNTRIQVEHGITEMVTGVDIVALQLAIANGEGLSLTQTDVVSNGASIECRIYAEDPRLAFRPSTGRLQTLRFPAATSSVRIDSGFREGDVVTPHYDPLIAKIMTHADDRRHCLRLMEQALGEVVIEGVKTNVDLLRRTIHHQAFTVPGRVHTGFFVEHARDLALG